MMHRNNLFTFVSLIISMMCLFSVASQMSAQSISSQQALANAQQYLQQDRMNAPSRGGVTTQLSIQHIESLGAETYYYVIGSESSEGYLIVSGHEAAKVILADVEEGHFDIDSIAPAMRWLLGTYTEQIHEAYTNPANVEQRKASERNAAAARSTIDNFMPQKWNQDAPYNLGITNSKNGYPIGCVNTATAQIMKYFSHPSQATNPAMEAYALGSTTAQAVEANRKLNFSSMTNTYASDATSYSGSNKAVADLMYLIARLNKTSFKTSGSGASCLNTGENLLDYCDYDKTMEYVTKSNFASSEWDEMMYAEMAAKRPVLYSGYDNDRGSGHAFVLSGYKSSTYYINWGWGGSGNGWFALDACNVYDRKYNDGQYAITHITKNAGGVPKITMKSYSVEKNDVGIGEYLSVNLNYQCFTLKTPVYSWQTRLKNKSTGNIISLHQVNNRSMSTNYGGDGKINVTDTITTNFKAGEQYEVLLYYKQGDGSWTQVSQSTTPVITIVQRATFNAVTIDNTDVSRGSSVKLSYHYMNTRGGGLSVYYDLGATLINKTQNRDTTLIFSKAMSVYYAYDSELTTNVSMSIPATFDPGDVIEIKTEYRVDGQDTWYAINQEPITFTLGNELDFLSYTLDTSGDQVQENSFAGNLVYTCRSSLRKTAAIGIHYEGIDTKFDSVHVITSSFSVYVGTNKSYSLSNRLLSCLPWHKKYRLSMVYRWSGETEWRTVPNSTPSEIRIVPNITFHSFSWPSSEVMSSYRDTITITYTAQPCYRNLCYPLGVHYEGQSSGVDTILTAITAFPWKEGENMSYKYRYSLPSTLWLGEQVKVCACYKEPKGEWTDFDQQPATFRVTDCYRFNSLTPENDTLYIGGSAKFVVNYASLHEYGKPYYSMGLKLHNLTSSIKDTIIVLTNNFYQGKKTESTDVSYTLYMPKNYNRDDLVEATLVYRPLDMDEWKSASSTTQRIKMIEVYEFTGFSSTTTEAAIQSSVSLKLNFKVLKSGQNPSYQVALRVHNLTTPIEDQIVESSTTIYSSYISERTAMLSCSIPLLYNVGDKLQFTALYRQEGADDWIEVDVDPVTVDVVAPKSGFILLESPTVANDGYITKQNYEVHILFKNLLSTQVSTFIDLDIYYNGSYKGFIRGSLTLEAGATQEFVMTAANSSGTILDSMTPGEDYRFAVYASNVGTIWAYSKNPVLHFLALGDVTQDGNNDNEDVSAVTLHLADPEGHPFDKPSAVAADANGDGKITIADLTSLIEIVK